VDRSRVLFCFDTFLSLTSGDVTAFFSRIGMFSGRDFADAA
jgi:hypothetical protein